MDNLSSLNRPLYKDTSIYKDNSIKIHSNKDKVIKIPSPNNLYKDREQIQLSYIAIKEFQDLHETKFGYRPNDEEAEFELLKLMRVVVLIQPESHRLVGCSPVNTSKNKL